MLHSTLIVEEQGTMNSLKTIQVISGIIKRIKGSFDSERDEILKSVKENFRMDSNEKWVATRLRMILFKMRGDIDSFQLIEGKNQKTLKNKLRKKSKSSNILTQNKKQSPKTQTPQQKKVKGKLTLEERQLNKLRQ